MKCLSWERFVARLLLRFGKEPHVSTGIDGSTTMGYGILDFNGFWQYPLTDREIRKRGNVKELAAQLVKALDVVEGLARRVAELEEWIEMHEDLPSSEAHLPEKSPEEVEYEQELAVETEEN